MRGLIHLLVSYVECVEQRGWYVHLCLIRSIILPILIQLPRASEKLLIWAFLGKAERWVAHITRIILHAYTLIPCLHARFIESSASKIELFVKILTYGCCTAIRYIITIIFARKHYVFFATWLIVPRNLSFWLSMYILVWLSGIKHDPGRIGFWVTLLVLVERHWDAMGCI